jgi:hypothetical protein
MGTRKKKEKRAIKLSRTIKITEVDADGNRKTSDKVAEGDAARYIEFLEKCMRAGFDFRETILQILNAATTIFEMGYIPSDDEFYELTPEQYEKFEEQAQHNKDLAEAEGNIYMILPKDPRYQSASREVEVVTEDQMKWFGKAEKVFDQYCIDYGKTFTTIEQKLTWLTTVLPPAMSAGSKYRRNQLHLV